MPAAYHRGRVREPVEGSRVKLRRRVTAVAVYKAAGERAASGKCEVLCSSGGMACPNGHMCHDGICGMAR